MCAGPLPSSCQKLFAASKSTEFAQKGKRVGFIALPPHGMSQRLRYPAIPVDFSLKFSYPDHSARTIGMHSRALPIVMQTVVPRVSSTKKAELTRSLRQRGRGGNSNWLDC